MKRMFQIHLVLVAMKDYAFCAKTTNIPKKFSPVLHSVRVNINYIVHSVRVMVHHDQKMGCLGCLDGCDNLFSHLCTYVPDFPDPLANLSARALAVRAASVYSD